MQNIIIKNLTFSYPNSVSDTPLFNNVSLTLNSNWKLALVGENGRGKTTLLKILQQQVDYSGEIITKSQFRYFPTPLDKMTKLFEQLQNNALDHFAFPNYSDKSEPASFERWALERELSILSVDLNVLTRDYSSLSPGEQVKVQVALLFLEQEITDVFLLLDEPTNHLDSSACAILAHYLSRKTGFIVVSHNSDFLNTCTDHTLSISKNNIELFDGKYREFKKQSRIKEDFERKANAKLAKEVQKLKQSADVLNGFSKSAELNKIRKSGQSDNRVDTGYIGKKAAKLAKRAKVQEQRQLKALDFKNNLLKDAQNDLVLFAELHFSSEELLDGTNIRIKEQVVKFNKHGGLKLLCERVVE